MVEVSLVDLAVLLNKVVLIMAVTVQPAKTSQMTNTPLLSISNMAQIINMDKARNLSTSGAKEIATTLTMGAATLAKTPTILTPAVRVITDTTITDNLNQQTNNFQTMIHIDRNKTRTSTTINRWEATIPASKT